MANWDSLIRESELTADQRKQFFTQLANQKIWQRKNAKDIVSEDNGDHLFTLPNAIKHFKSYNLHRFESFHGAVLGGINLPAHCTIDNKFTKVTDPVTNRVYRVNAACGSTRFAPWDAFGEDGQSVIVRYAERLLIEALQVNNSIDLDELAKQGFSVSQLLQCNINFYRYTDEMGQHRDDHLNPGLEPPVLTFFPAVVTMFLTPGDQVSHSFDFYGCEECFSIPQEYSNTSKQCKRSHSSSEPSMRSITPSDVIVLADKAYTYGLHSVKRVRGYAPDSADGDFSRMSLNFRIVTPHTWNLLYKNNPNATAHDLNNT